MVLTFANNFKKIGYTILLILSALLLFISILELLDGWQVVFMVRRVTRLRSLETSLLDLNFEIPLLLCLSVAVLCMTLMYLRRREMLPYLLILIIISSAMLVNFLILHSAKFAAIIGLLSTMLAMYFLIKSLETRTVLISFAYSLVSIVIVLQILSLIGWLYLPFYSSATFPDSWNVFMRLETYLFYALSPIAPVAAMLLFLIWPLSYLFKTVFGLQRNTSNMSVTTEHSDLKIRMSEKVFLALGLSLPVIITLYAYSPNINPESESVSVDVTMYTSWLERASMLNSLDDILMAFFHSDRGIMLLGMYVTMEIFDIPAKTVVMFAPVVLGPLLVLAVYVFTKTVTESKLTASIASFMTGSGYVTTTFLYGGLMANWLALSLIYFALAALTIALKQNSYKWLGISIIPSIIAIFTHVIWNLLFFTTLAYFVLLIFKRFNISEQQRKVALTIVGCFVLSGMLINVVWYHVIVERFFNSSLTISPIGGMRFMVSMTSFITLENLLSFWQQNLFTFQHYFGGLFMIPLSYVLAIIGFLNLLSKEDHTSRISMLWILIASFLYIFGNVTMQARILQNVPIDFFAANGLLALNRRLLNTNSALSPLILPILLSYLTYAFRAAANLAF